MRMVKRNISGFSVITAFIVLFTVVFTLFHSNKPLTPYIESSNENVSKSEKSERDYITYTDDELHFSISIPSDWTKVIQNGYHTWICKEYNSSFQIQKFPASAELLNITGDTICQEITALGGELLDFFWIDEWNYTVSYRMYQKSGTTAHIELTAFNTKNAVRFSFVITETNYDKISDTVEEMIDSFVWDRFNVDIVPDDSKPEF